MLFGLNLQQGRSLLAGFVCMLIYGTSYTYGTLVPYLLSYIYYYGDKEITANQMAMLLPTSIVILNLGMPLNNINKLQFSNRLTCLISVIGVSIAVFLTSFCNHFWMLVLVYGLIFGLFIGYGYMAPIKNCYEHIPDRKGLCSGMCILGYGIAPLLFNVLLQMLINPHNQSMEKVGDRLVFSLEIADNVPFAMRVMAGVYLGIGMLGAFLVRAPLSKKDQLVAHDEQDKVSTISKEEEAGLEPTKTTQTMSHIVSFIVRKKIHLLTLTLTCSVPFGMFVAFNYKEYGTTRIYDDNFLTTVGSCGSIFNGLGRLLFGMLLDKFSFKVLSSFINIVLIVFGLSISLIVQNEYLYLVAVSMIYFVYGGNYSIYPTQTVRVFGNSLGPKVYYMVFLGFTVACLIQYLSRVFIVHEETRYEDFRICFFIFAGFNVVSLLLTLFVKYDYEEDITPKIEMEPAKQ